MREQDSEYLDPRVDDIAYGDRRISRPDSSLPDWEVPDTAYRPVPIVWFTGAFFVHFFAVLVLLGMLASQAEWLTVGACALAAVAVGKWTWERGMKSAGVGWKIATVAMLAFNLLFALDVASA